MPVKVVQRRPTVFMPTWDVAAASMFTKYNCKVTGLMTTPFDVVCFTDGPPIAPFLYGEKKLPQLKLNLKRDQEELLLLRRIGVRKPKIGLGRGAHLLNMFSGGSSWQHIVGGHEQGLHPIECMITGNKIWTTTEHTQVMIPCDGADILATCNETKVYVGENFEMKNAEMKNDSGADVEACFYNHTNSLCYQPSPQLGHSKTMDHFFFVLGENLTFKDNQVSF